MNLEGLKKIWKKEEEYSFKGWDFSHINNRMKEESLPWDYKQIVKSYMKKEKILLDMGTGGGEFLLSLNPTSGKTFATEGYPPNIKLSTSVLSPYGIEVRAVSDDNYLPFEDNKFDIIINRHEAFCLSEVNRILKPGGIFITQQVGGSNNKEISNYLLGNPNVADYDFNLNNTLEKAKNNRFKIIDKGECFPKAYFYDVGALVYFAKIIQWEFPHFSVDKCFDKLIELHKEIENKGYIETLEHRFFMICLKI